MLAYDDTSTRTIELGTNHQNGDFDSYQLLDGKLLILSSQYTVFKGFEKRNQLHKILTVDEAGNMTEQQLPKLDLNRYDLKDYKRLNNGDSLYKGIISSGWDLDKQTLVLICFNSQNEKKWEHSMVGFKYAEGIEIHLTPNGFFIASGFWKPIMVNKTTLTGTLKDGFLAIWFNYSGSVTGSFVTNGRYEYHLSNGGDCYLFGNNASKEKNVIGNWEYPYGYDHVIEINNKGKVLWKTKFDRIDYLTIATDSNNQVYMLGRMDGQKITIGKFTVKPNSLPSQDFLARLDSKGECQYIKSIEFLDNDSQDSVWISWPPRLLVTDHGVIYIACYFSQSQPSEGELVVFSIDSTTNKTIRISATEENRYGYGVVDLLSYRDSIFYIITSDVGGRGAILLQRREHHCYGCWS